MATRISSGWVPSMSITFFGPFPAGGRGLSPPAAAPPCGFDGDLFAPFPQIPRSPRVPRIASRAPPLRPEVRRPLLRLHRQVPARRPVPPPVPPRLRLPARPRVCPPPEPRRPAAFHGHGPGGGSVGALS